MCQEVQIPTCTRHAVYAIDACFNASDFFKSAWATSCYFGGNLPDSVLEIPRAAWPLMIAFGFANAKTFLHSE